MASIHGLTRAINNTVATPIIFQFNLDDGVVSAEEDTGPDRTALCVDPAKN